MVRNPYRIHTESRQDVHETRVKSRTGFYGEKHAPNVDLMFDGKALEPLADVEEDSLCVGE
jgi:hypothetical protein